MAGLIVAFALCAVAALYFAGIHRGLAGLRENIKAAWAGIDVLLKLRHEELPKLVEICGRHRIDEPGTFEKILRARAAVDRARQARDVAAVCAAERRLRAALGMLSLVVETHPRLRADQAFTRLRDRIAALESCIAERREFYNQQVSLNNIRVGRLPDALIAGWFGFDLVQLFEFIDLEERRVAEPGMPLSVARGT
jgi:LemA protein